MYVASRQARTHARTHNIIIHAGRQAGTHARTHATLGGVISTASERVLRSVSSTARPRRRVTPFQRSPNPRKYFLPSFLPSFLSFLLFRKCNVTIAALNSSFISKYIYISTKSILSRFDRVRFANAWCEFCLNFEINLRIKGKYFRGGMRETILWFVHLSARELRSVTALEAR